MGAAHKLKRTGACVLGLAALGAGAVHADPTPAAERVLSVVVAGDALINQPWSRLADGDFLQVVHYSRNASVSVVNLETTLGDFTGFPQKDSGGTYLMARPHIAAELAWAGIDMVGAANNHSFD